MYLMSLSVVYSTPMELLSAQTEPLVPPVNVLNLCQDAGIDVYATNFTEDDGEDVSGSIEIEDGQPVIYVNQEHPETRQRFTVAHELGHWFSGHLVGKDDKIIDNATCRRSSYWDAKERQANQFAAELLMPSVLLKKAIASGIKDVYDLSLLFNVSIEAMSYRLQKIRPFLR
jgi:Zn-dependent peptidase ImmA (M78 family)